MHFATYHRPFSIAFSFFKPTVNSFHLKWIKHFYCFNCNVIPIFRSITNENVKFRCGSNHIYFVLRFAERFSFYDMGSLTIRRIDLTVMIIQKFSIIRLQLKVYFSFSVQRTIACRGGCHFTRHWLNSTELLEFLNLRLWFELFFFRCLCKASNRIRDDLKYIRPNTPSNRSNLSIWAYVLLLIIPFNFVICGNVISVFFFFFSSIFLKLP